VKVLVYGWYHQGNIGDDLFIDAYRHLFPDIDFEFSEKITANKLKNVDAVFFGGGSFLFDCPQITSDALPILSTKKVFYLGVGVEADIHPVHQELMSRASLIATRSADQIERLKGINPNVRLIPDLVYSLQPLLSKPPKVSKSVLVMTNIAVVPNNSDPHWKHASWTYFKSEFGQFLDWLLEAGYRPSLFSMCRGLNLDDDWASAELVSAMSRRSRNRILLERPAGIKEVSELVARHEMVITQRFHGIVLAEMTRTPYIAIHHHDKLKFSQPSDGTFLSYYNCSKHSYISAFEQTINMKFANTLPIESTIFETFSKEVTSLI
jgi:polysaccharide pyruvyl transferase WcaK-like protein